MASAPPFRRGEQRQRVSLEFDRHECRSWRSTESNMDDKACVSSSFYRIMSILEFCTAVNRCNFHSYGSCLTSRQSAPLSGWERIRPLDVRYVALRSYCIKALPAARCGVCSKTRSGTMQHDTSAIHRQRETSSKYYVGSTPALVNERDSSIYPLMLASLFMFCARDMGGTGQFVN